MDKNEIEVKYNERYQLYCASNGTVFNCRGKIIATRIKEGRHVFTWVDERGKVHYNSVARVVCDTFYPRIHDNDVVIHRDGNILNDRADNLQWVSRSAAKTIMWEYHGDSYKIPTGSIVYGAVDYDHYKTGQYKVRYSDVHTAIENGYNPARIRASFLFDKRYKGLYWFIESKSRFDGKKIKKIQKKY